MCVIDVISEGFLTSQWPNKLSNVGVIKKYEAKTLPPEEKEALF